MFKQFLSRGTLLYGGFIALVAGMVHFYGVGWAITTVILAEGWRWWRRIHLDDAHWEVGAERLVLSLGTVALMGLVRLPLLIILALSWWVWSIWLLQEGNPKAWLLRATVHQALAMTAIFDAVAIWHLAPIIALILVWVASLLVARRWLTALAETAAPILSAAWGLVVAELAWVMSLWQVSYVMPGGWIIIPQAAIVVLSLGYCFASIYVAHRQNRLSRWRLTEYGIIGLGLLIIVIAGTHWNGSI